MREGKGKRKWEEEEDGEEITQKKEGKQSYEQDEGRGQEG